MKYKRLWSLLLPLAVGIISMLAVCNGISQFNLVGKPEATPPSWVFIIVWIILYLLMGVSANIMSEINAPAKSKKTAKIIYYTQLAANFVWPIIFFGIKSYLFAVIWLVLLWVIIIAMINGFTRISKRAAYLQLPYLIWVTYEVYLNYMVYIMNSGRILM